MYGKGPGRDMERMIFGVVGARPQKGSQEGESHEPIHVPASTLVGTCRLCQVALHLSTCLSCGWIKSLLVNTESYAKGRPGHFPAVFLGAELTWGILKHALRNQNYFSCLQRQGAGGNYQLTLLRITIVKLSPR